MSSPDVIPVSLFALLREQFGTSLQPLRCCKATLVHISHSLEDLVLSQQLPALLFTGFQESSHWREETERYRALASIAQQVCIFAGGQLPPESNASELHITLRGDDPLRQEWFLALLCPQFAVLLCGQDRMVPGEEEATRSFDTLWSFHPAVIGQVLDLLERVVGSYRPERLEALQAARARFPLVAPDPDLVTRFTSELIRYEEELQQRLFSTTNQLQQQFRWREDLLATLIHDLRNPLQGVRLSLDMINMVHSSGKRDLSRVIERGQTAVQQLQDLIQMILDTNQLADGELPLELLPLDMPTWVEEALLGSRPLAELNRVALTGEAQPLTVWADASLLGRALNNLVGNAIKFTPQGGQVHVSITAAPQSGLIEIRVRDSGRGISSDDLPHIFERYHQGQSKDRRGYGLGLFFCRLVAQAHGGTIRVASQLGVGSTFTLTLPEQPLDL